MLLFTNASHSFPDGNEPWKLAPTLPGASTPPPMGTVGAGQAANVPPAPPMPRCRGLPLTTL